MDDSAFSFDSFEVLPDLATRLRMKQDGGCGGSVTTLRTLKEKQPRNSKAANGRNSKTTQVEAITISSDEEEGDKNVEKENEGEISFISEMSKSESFSHRRKGSESDGASQRRHMDVLSSSDVNLQPEDCLAPIFRKQNQVLSASQVIDPVSSPPLTKTDAKKRAVEERKIERERLKKQKIEEKERLKQQKLIEKAAKKADSLSECTKWLQVCVGHELLRREGMEELPGAVKTAGLLWTPDPHPLLGDAVTFCRLCPVTGQVRGPVRGSEWCDGRVVRKSVEWQYADRVATSRE
ncbi:hypothetical protein FHG87_024213 [Trinorchestia longiramus]|nr:hypothetical protein FHG87_024213 [Trinorchestia longiramus]